MKFLNAFLPEFLIKKKVQRFDYIVSFCFWNTKENRHRFGSVFLKEGEYDFNEVGSELRLSNAVRYYAEPIETEFQIISKSKI